MRRVVKRTRRTAAPTSVKVRTLFDLNLFQVKSTIGGGSNTTTETTTETPISEMEVIDLTQDDTELAETKVEISMKEQVLLSSNTKIETQAEDSVSPGSDLGANLKVEDATTSESEVKKARTRTMKWFKKLAFHDVTVAVDCFNCDKEPGIDLYFLSHFHADHYGGLKKSWCHGSVIYTSEHTANLVKWKFKVNQCKLVGLPINDWFSFSPHCRVILLDANHCPGSVIFLFHDMKLDSYILHTGDFRANERIVDEVNLLTGNKTLSCIYLDTTYLNPHFRFPALKNVCEVTADFASLLSKNGLNSFLNNSQKQRSISHYLNLFQRKPILFVVLSYSIGKEHLAIHIANKLGSKLYVPHTKYQLVKQYISWFPDNLITTNLKGSNVHLVSMHTDLDKYLSQVKHMFDSIVVFKPTGWTFTNQYDNSYLTWDDYRREAWVRETLNTEIPFNIENFTKQNRSTGKIYYFNVPYSEHSSFKDLCQFSIKLKWDKIIPTVNLSKYEEMERWFELWKRYEE